ncbi:MAG: TRAP transporter TatT component family protein [Sandaracinaceae bacterium]|nr:TRAP transporter TatT component family protein [Sandaracinaceae bacterium]
MQVRKCFWRALLGVFVLCSGCDLQLMAASTSVAVARRAAPGINYMRDPEIAEAAIPSVIQQNEALVYLLPDDAGVITSAVRVYASYGYGFLEDKMEQAEFDGAEEQVIEHYRQRAGLAYLRAREIAFQWLDRKRPEEGGILGVQRKGLEAFTQHIKKFTSEEEAIVLFWAAYSWARYINLNRDKMDALADLPYVSAIADHVNAIIPSYYDYGPVALRAGLMAAAPPALGGRHAEAKAEFERAIQLSGRHNLLFLVTEARLVAVPLQDRALYRSLLEEVLRFDVDSKPEHRLPNLLAQRRARRYLAEIDNLFPPEEEGGES